MLTTHIIGEAAELESLGGAWEALLARSAANELVLSPEWILTWWRIFGSVGRRSMRTLTFWRGDELVGLALLSSRFALSKPGLPVRRLEYLASGEPEAEEICSEYLGVIADRDHEEAVAEAFARAVCGGELGAWGEILLPAMNGQLQVPSLVMEAFRREGMDVAVTARSLAPYVPLPGSWDAYLAALSSKRRYFVRRSLRDFEAWAGSEPSLTFATTQAELERACQTFHELHEERWMASGRTGAFEAARFRAFHNLIRPRLLERGALQMGSLEVRGEPVAAFYNFVWNRKVYFYQSGRRTGLPGHIRPGIVMHAYLIRHAIAEGMREYDFLAGTPRYKLELAPEMREVITVRVARPSLAETTRRAAAFVLRRARRLHSIAAASRARNAESKPEPSPRARAARPASRS
jgi:CelD/BcsL family acetyltransferase involved in cellulose biosynthesis